MNAKDLWLGRRPASKLLILEPAPKGEREPDPELEERFETLQRVVGGVRTSRANARVADNVKLNASVEMRDPSMAELLTQTAPVLSSLANLASIAVSDEKPEGSVSIVDPAFELHIDLGKHVDLDQELKRIDKELADAQKKLAQVTKKLENPKFLSGAKPDVVEAQREKDKELRDVIEGLESLKNDLGA